jgi:hypothetical protein
MLALAKAGFDDSIGSVALKNSARSVPAEWRLGKTSCRRGA